jgi:hypothetical protein
MAKITEHKEDKIGGLSLYLAAVALITLLAIAAQIRHPHYYFWALVVSYFWGIAMHERTPNLYKSARKAGIWYLFLGGLLTASVAFITMVFRDLDQFIENLFQMP